ncbi:hypothetical protein CO151_09470 [bacterium CG_4_9_14_3_um_filter_65_15]|nr:MAG: hypothetical protein CO151_09470 [bacterium CG_4_9_14_3_um_filter_65_15]
MSDASAVDQTWFGDFSLSLDKTAYWQIGPSEIWLTRSSQEWRFTGRTGTNPLNMTLKHLPDGGDPEPEESTVGPLRLGFKNAPERLSLLPMMADRPFVVKPATPFMLPPGQEVTLYLSTVLWLQVAVGDPSQEFLQMPLFLPSDTWFGDSTLDGEMCYALQTSARLRLENLPVRPHRAVSALTVRNKSHANLEVEKVLFPAPQMSLFAGESGHLWTESLTLVHTSEHHDAPLILKDSPPSQAGQTRKVVGPRQAAPRSILTRAFSEMLGGGY